MPWDTGNYDIQPAAFQRYTPSPSVCCEFPAQHELRWKTLVCGVRLAVLDAYRALLELLRTAIGGGHCDYARLGSSYGADRCVLYTLQLG